ncbi:MAG: transcriptional regulator with XRE-family HTH domain [Candidatus Omnitrophota bacterium]|jgi:transcriptional regulator with XRE-family HTH domain
MTKNKTRKVDEYLKDKLKDPYFKELWELEEQKLSMVKPIIAYRIKNKLTQTQLAKAIGVTQQYISNIENGVFSSMITLEKVLLFIGYTVKIKALPLTRSTKERLLKLFKTSKWHAQFA